MHEDMHAVVLKNLLSIPKTEPVLFGTMFKLHISKNTSRYMIVHEP